MPGDIDSGAPTDNRANRETGELSPEKQLFIDLVGQLANPPPHSGSKISETVGLGVYELDEGRVLVAQKDDLARGPIEGFTGIVWSLAVVRTDDGLHEKMFGVSDTGDIDGTWLEEDEDGEVEVEVDLDCFTEDPKDKEDLLIAFMEGHMHLGRYRSGEVTTPDELAKLFVPYIPYRPQADSNPR